MNIILEIHMLYNLYDMPRRISLSEFRLVIREVVHDAEIGEPTILTHYGRDVAAIVPVAMFGPALSAKKKRPRTAPPFPGKGVAS